MNYPPPPLRMRWGFPTSPRNSFEKLSFDVWLFVVVDLIKIKSFEIPCPQGVLAIDPWITIASNI